MPRPALRGDVFHAIASPVRRAILDRLRRGEQPVAALATPFAMTLAAVSQQLRVLRVAGLVVERRKGRQRLYCLHPDPLKGAREWLLTYESLLVKRSRPPVEYLID
jgi:DNA-binding transcriptional ArsR family regulator